MIHLRRLAITAALIGFTLQSLAETPGSQVQEVLVPADHVAFEMDLLRSIHPENTVLKFRHQGVRFEKVFPQEASLTTQGGACSEVGVSVGSSPSDQIEVSVWTTCYVAGLPVLIRDPRGVSHWLDG